MNDTSQISFIPKGSLAREETFLERPRPRSLLGLFATFVFLASVGSYVGLYFYNNILADRINGMALQVQNIQKDFEQPEIAQARVFRARAELAQSLFNEHIIATPVFDFLAANTVESIFYHDLKFARGEKGALSLDVSGEAPSYTSLAYQADVFRQKSEELLDFSVGNITLTRTGSVGFVLHMTFAPQYLSYIGSFTKEGDGGEATFEGSPLSASASVSPESVDDASIPAVSETQCEVPLIAKTIEDGSTVCAEPEVQETKGTQASFLSSFWLQFKFW